MMENVPPLLPTTSRPDIDQPTAPFGSEHKRTEPPTANLLLTHGITDPTADDTPGTEHQHLPDVSKDVRAWVTQRLRRAPPASFITDDEDSASDDDASLRKWWHRHIKSGRLRTRDSHILHRIKWLHEVVMVSQGKTSVYEDISLALFSNGYLSVVSEESKDPCHTRIHACSFEANV